MAEHHQQNNFSFKKIIYRKIKEFLAPEILQLYRRKIGNKNNNVEDPLKSFPRYISASVNLKGRSILVPDVASFRWMHKEIFLQEIYRFEAPGPDPFIIDAGANIGLATIYFKLLYPKSSIIAFEPDPNIFKYLEQNIKSFKFKKVTLFKKGLWNENTNLSFRSEGADAGAIAHLSNEIPDEETTIEVVSIKEYLNQKVDFLKMDIEGAETLVLKDIEDKLGNVDRIFVEYHSFAGQKQSLNEIIGILTGAGYRLYISIPGNKSLASPFMGLKEYHGMDLQLNIFGAKESIE